jgi:hypothetical protein
MRKEEEVSVTLGDGIAVIHRSGNSRAVIARVLGVEPVGSTQPARIWLDRIVHRPGERAFVGWDVSGAVVTQLERALEGSGVRVTM